jgi:DeoR/GlpR family transcriptional regulator of sugar metabolism
MISSVSQGQINNQATFQQNTSNRNTSKVHAMATRAIGHENATAAMSNPELQFLKNNCNIIRNHVLNKYGDSSASRIELRSEITGYLQAIGTPTALQLLKEFEADRSIMGCNGSSGWLV